MIGHGWQPPRCGRGRQPARSCGVLVSTVMLVLLAASCGGGEVTKSYSGDDSWDSDDDYSATASVASEGMTSFSTGDGEAAPQSWESARDFDDASGQYGYADAAGSPAASVEEAETAAARLGEVDAEALGYGLANFIDMAAADDAPPPVADDGQDAVEDQDSAPEVPEAAASRPGAGEADAAMPSLAGSPLGRDIIYRANLKLETEDVKAVSREAMAVIAGIGGFVFGQESRTEPDVWTVLTFKVPPADFPRALERLAALGTPTDQRVDTDDVTERIVDLESRVITSQASVARLREFLADASRIEDIAYIESELLDRETTLETLRGQLRTLRGQVAMATIVLTIAQSPVEWRETGMAVSLWASAAPEDASEDPCLGEQNVVVEPVSTLSLCLDVENTGEAALAALDIESQPLRLNKGSFELVQGSFDRIGPGDRLLAVLSMPVMEGRLGGRVVSRGIGLRIDVSAVPVDEDDVELGEAVEGGADVFVEISEDSTLPGFSDSLDAGLTVFKRVVGFATVLVGVLIPILPLLAPTGALIWWWRRARRRRRITGRGDDAGSRPPA